MQCTHDRGFTLIEMVMTIVLTGIIAGMLAPIIKTNVDAYIDTQSRSHLLDKMRISLGRLSRELRQATIPLTTVSGSTLEFVTTTVGGSYVSFNDVLPKIASADCSRVRNQTPSQLERFLPNEPIGTLCVLYPGDLSALSAEQRNALVIGRIVAPISSISSQISGSPDEYDSALWKVAFNAETTFSSASSSAAHTFSLADYRHRISLNSGNLVWQRVAASTTGFGSATSGILVNNITSFTPTLDSAKGIVSITLTATEGAESITVSEDIYVRN
jgi:prepilin-type N-terminal cleavage/methylation domain-containing protein